MPQVFSGNGLHHDVKLPLVAIDVIHVEHMRMIECRGFSRIGQESLHDVRPLREPSRQSLDGDVTFQLGMQG